MDTKVFPLCISDDSCPILEVADDYVIIGEEPRNSVVLSLSEFEKLKSLIKEGKI